MTRPFRVLLVALLALLPSSREALSQRSYALGVGGGAAIPVGRLSDSQNAGYNGIVALAIGAADFPIGIRLDGIYNTFVFHTAPPGSPISSDLRVIGALFNVIFAFTASTAKPYLIMGGGLYNTRGEVPGAKSENNFGFSGGLGATFAVGPIATFLESRYHTISRNEERGGVVQFVPITVGLMF
jgi:hypothetical protein